MNLADLLFSARLRADNIRLAHAVELMTVRIAVLERREADLARQLRAAQQELAYERRFHAAAIAALRKYLPVHTIYVALIAGSGKDG
jgi:hypothetical protein